MRPVPHAAMVAPAGVTAGEFAARSAPWPAAMVQRLIQRQIDAGHGAEDFARIIESIGRPG